MAIFSSRQSMHLFEVLVYAGADLLIFQDISEFSLESRTYFERAVLSAYLLLVKENLCALFLFSMVLLLVLYKLSWFVLCFGSCLVNNAWLKEVSIKGAFSLCSAVACWCCWIRFGVDNFLVVLFDNHGHILYAVVANFNGVFVTYLVAFA